MIWLFACQATDSQSQLQSALQHQEPLRCQDLPEELRLECMLSILQQTVPKDINEALQSCGPIEEQKWRGECFFLVSDIGELVGDDAIAVCQIAEPFSEDCLRHAAARDVEVNLFTSTGHKEPMKLMSAIERKLQRYLPLSISQPMARDMMLRWKVSTISPPFSRQHCEGLPTDMCAQLYLLASLGTGAQWTGQEGWWSECGRPLTPSQAEQYSFWGWEPDVEQTVAMSWQQLCTAGQAIKPEAR